MIKMFRKNIKNGRRNISKRGNTALQLFVEIVVAVVLALIIINIVNNSANGSSGTLFKLFEKYKSPKLTSTAFLYDASNVKISPDSMGDSGCTAIGTNGFDCKADMPISFLVDVNNGYTKMLKLAGATAVCEVDCNRRRQCTPPNECGQSLTTYGPYRSIENGKSVADVDAGTYSFARGKTYFVYSAARCALDPTYGCYSASMTDADSYYNEKNYIQITGT